MLRRKNRLKTVLWYSSVSLLVLLAVIFSVARILFSTVDDYRARLEEAAGRQLGQPVTIAGLDARLSGISPTLILQDVALLQQGSRAQLTRFHSVSISLDPIASLRQAMPIIELAVGGANLELTHSLDGSFTIQGLELAAGGDDEGDGDDGTSAEEVVERDGALGAWFLSQTRLALRDSRITLHNEKSGERWRFSGVDLELNNSGNRHRLNGFVRLPRDIGQELRVAVDIRGDLLRGSDWGGDIYIKSVQLQSRQWRELLSWEGGSLQQGMLDMELWGNWRQGRLASARSRFSAADLVLKSGDERLTLAQLSADARLQLQEQGWRVDIADLQVRHGSEAVSPSRLSLSLLDENFSLRADQLELAALAPLLPALPQLEEEQRQMLRQMAPGGRLEGLRLERSAAGEVALQGALKGLALQAWQKFPGVSGLDARFGFNGDDGRIALEITAGELDLPRLFRAPLALQRLTGELALHREADGWYLYSDALSVRNHHLEARLAMELQLTRGETPWLSLQGRFQADDARAVPHYLPAKIMKEKSLYWLDHAFMAGQVPSGRLQYHGPLDRSPFRGKGGRFEVLFDAEAVQLHYRDEWPDLQQVRGEVHFDGPGMRIAAHSARVFGAQVGETRVSIENLRMGRLLVDGGAQMPVEDGLRFLRESPLSRNGGKFLDTLRAQGGAKLNLKLAIPLTPQVRKLSPLSVQGRVDFSDNRLAVTDGVVFDRVDGSLHFTEKEFSAEQITARLFNEPVSLVVMSEGGDKPQVVVGARGRAALPALRDAFKLSLLDYLEGEGAWQAMLTLPRGVSAEGAVLRIDSDMQGIASTLPPPLAKEATETRDLSLTLYLSGVRRGERRITVDQGFGLAWQQHDRGGLRRAHLSLGRIEPLELPSRNIIEVSGSHGVLPLAAWRQVLRRVDGAATTPSSSNSGGPLPVVVKMKQLQLVSDGVETGGQGAEKRLHSGELPQLTFEVEEFSYDDLRLGKVSLRLVPRGRRVAIKDVTLQSRAFNLSGSGSWTEEGNTFFDFKLDSPSLGGLMRHFDFATVVKGGKTRASGKLWWAGSPADISLAGLNAQLNLKVSDGTLVDVKQGAGRMLGIFSLPALPRRLFLDFSDVLKEGLEFESIKGDLRIELGEAYTSNLRLESTTANILITGRTGLVAQDFDQDIYVVPNVKDTVSVASALAWGPQVAAVVALLQEVFRSDIEAATMFQYKISGHWQDPEIRRVVQEIGPQEEPFFVE